jgi:hypothetical protein
MTQLMHNLIATAIFIIFWEIFGIKKLFWDDKEMQWLRDNIWKLLS